MQIETLNITEIFNVIKIKKSSNNYHQISTKIKSLIKETLVVRFY